MRCEGCGEELPEGAVFCPSCGHAVEGPRGAGERDDASAEQGDATPASGDGGTNVLAAPDGATTVMAPGDDATTLLPSQDGATTLLGSDEATRVAARAQAEPEGDGLDVPVDDLSSPAPTRYCMNCGERIPADCAFCPSCGCPTDQPVAPPVPSEELGGQPLGDVPPRRRHTGAVVAAVVLALVVLGCAGVVGAHYFGLLGDPAFLSFLPMREEPDDGEGQAEQADDAESEQDEDKDEEESEEEPELVELDDLTGLSEQEARSAIAAEGLSVGTIDHEYSDEVLEGRVISQSVAPGEVEEGTVVDLVVSDGPDPAAQDDGRTSERTSDGHRYEVVTEAMTWEEAQAWCEANGCHLATIGSQSEWEDVLALMQGSGREIFWLGATRDGSGDFAWVDGTPFSFTAFAAGEPNDDGGVEDYLAVYDVEGSWGWYDAPNDLEPYYKSDRMAFVAEWDA